MTAPAEEALKLQRPLADGTLKIVMIGEKEDPAPVTLDTSTVFYAYAHDK